jgi:type IV pilus assembly protein PilV
MEQIMRSKRFRRPQSGLSLIEAMVAVFILAAGLLGLAALQGRSLAYAESSFYRSIAADLAADLADRIRANRPPFFGLTDDTPPLLAPGLAATPNLSTCTVTAGAVTGCPAAFNVQSDMTLWNTAVRAQLLNGRWTLTATSSGYQYIYTLTIFWLDDRSGKEGSYTTVIE